MNWAEYLDYFADADEGVGMAPSRLPETPLATPTYGPLGQLDLSAMKDWAGEHKGPLAIAGGSLLGGLAGKWAEESAWKDEKKWLKTAAKYTAAPEAVGKGLESAISFARSRRAPDLPRRVKQTGRQATMTSAARAGLPVSREVALAARGLETIKAAAAEVTSMQSTLQRGRERTIAGNIARKGDIKTAVAKGSAEYMRAQSLAAERRAAETGELWQQAIGGLTSLASLVFLMPSGPAPPLGTPPPGAV